MRHSSLVVLTLLLAACAATPPTITPAPTETPVPSATVNRSPIPTSEPTDAPTPTSTPRPPFAELPGAVDSAGCSRSAAAAGDSSIGIDVDGVARSALLHMPEGLARGQSVPLVLVLHGTFMRGDEMADMTGYSEVADERGFLVAYPDPTEDFPGWNSAESGDLVNDVAFVSGLLDYVEATYCVDQRRVYAAGFSAGGTMAHTAACRDARIAAIAMVSSGFAEGESICEPEPGIHTIDIQGVLDPLIPYLGGRNPLPEFDRAPRSRPVPDWTAEIARQNGCDLETAPHQLAQIGDWVVPFEWHACSAATILYRVGDGGHNWPGGTGLDVFGNINHDINASELSYTFFLAKPKPPVAHIYKNEAAGYQVALPASWTGGVWVDRYGYHTELAGSVTFPVGQPIYFDLYATQYVVSSGPIDYGVPTPSGRLHGRSATALANDLMNKMPGYSRTDYTLDVDGETVAVIAGTGLPMAGFFTHGDRAYLVFAYREVPFGEAPTLATFLKLFEFTD